MSAGSIDANALMTDLLTGETFDIPDVDLSTPEYDLPDSTDIVAPTQLSNADLTTSTIGGTGTFDVMMASVHAHLQGEFEKGRITGAEYTKAYIAMVEAAIGNSVQFLLGKDQSYWNAVQAQIQAQIAQTKLVQSRVELATAKVHLEAVRLEAATHKANFALTKLKLATEDVNYDIATYNLTSILPAQLAQLQSQKSKTDSEKALVDAEKLKVDQEKTNLVKQALLLDDEHALAGLKSSNLTKQNTKLDSENALLGKQSDQVTAELTLYPSKLTLLKEQGEVQRAQTLDTRSDNATVKGVVGKQKDLYGQQITSYQRDSEIKAAKIFTDSWITQKTIDEGLLAPNNFTNIELDEVLTKLRLNLSL